MSNLKTILKSNTTDKTEAMRQLMVKMRVDISQQLSKTMSGETFRNNALKIYSQSINLQNCEPLSFIGSMINATNIGLTPNTSFNQALLVPTKENGVDKVLLIITYEGLLDLGNRSEKIKSIYVHEVRENDYFDLDYGIEQKLSHKPLPKENRGGVIGYYAIYHLEPSGCNFLYMSKDEILETIGADIEDLDRVGKKTVLKQLLKHAPIEQEIHRAIALDKTTRDNINN